jgi:soluble lytic murein transglycosylase
MAAALTLVLLGAVPATSSAQIYSWRDANGNLVVSNRRPAGAAPETTRTFAVALAPTVRATRYAAPLQTRLYDDLIAQFSRVNGVREDLVRAVVQVESAFNPNARSPKGALGLMQLMPATVQQFGVHNPFNPFENIRAGVAYLRQLLDRYDNNETLALAAYNAGPSAVDRHGQSVPPYRETRDYVLRVNQAAGARQVTARDRIYKTTEVVDGREVPRYTDRKPSTDYDVVSR